MLNRQESYFAFRPDLFLYAPFVMAQTALAVVSGATIYSTAMAMKSFPFSFKDLFGRKKESSLENLR